MKVSPLASTILALCFHSLKVYACPYSNNSHEGIPDDATTHGFLRNRRKRLASLSEDSETKARLHSIISCQKRLLQNEGCVSNNTYESLRQALGEMANAITDPGDRGHFIGGIVRLAAHDFMDYDLNGPSNGEELGGADGCIDFSNAANAGLSDLWCDDPDICPFKALYDVAYPFMSKADFWIASASAVIKNTSNERLDMKFRWGRVDSDTCAHSSARLPEPSGCDQVESTFINRMGLSWTDATALLGAHTLGRGDANFSGHPGTWVRTDEESNIFDRKFYTELLSRGWIPRTFPPEDNIDNDWVWGGANLSVMMLNTDVCLYFDIDSMDVINAPCCTNTSANCRQGVSVQCPLSNNIRSEAFAAVEAFANIGNTVGNPNDPFFTAFASAWERATENGYESLNELRNNCEITDQPSQSPSQTCVDVDSFIDRKGNSRACTWVVEQGKCSRFGNNECPVSCGCCDGLC